jgi:hypothetical protein
MPLLIVGAFASPTPAQVAIGDVVGRMPIAEFNTYIGSQTYRDWGNEPFIAVDPTNNNNVLVSAFAYGTPGASVWYSTDGGTTFGIRFPITAPPSSSGGPNDQTFAYDGSGVVHTGMLTSFGPNQFVFHGSTPNPNNDGVNGHPATQWTWTGGNVASSTGAQPDQPWTVVRGSGASAKIFVAYDNFDSGFLNVEQRVAVSTNAGSSFSAPAPVSNGGRVGTTTNPGLRITADAAGTKVYSVFGIGTNNIGGVQFVNYRLNESIDGGATWRYTASSSGPGGLVVDSGNSAQLGGSSFGGKNQLRGNTTAVAVDATGSHVYVVYGKRNGAGVDQLFMAEFHPTTPGDVTSDLVLRGTTLISPAAEAAALPSITVTANGTVAIMYDTFASSRYHIHLTTSADFGMNFSDQEVYNFDPSFITLGSSAFPSSNRALGDYQYLTNIGDNLYGVFAAQGNVNAGGINTTNMVVPFVLTAAVPEPGSLLLAACAALSGRWLYRRNKTPRSAAD